MQQREVPVYLFNGFLECGKTKFIQETMSDKRFSQNEKTLLIVCEQGEIEYDESTFAVKDYKILQIDDEQELTQDLLEKWEKNFKPDNVVVEFNGMWTNDKLFNALPEGWLIAQIMTFFKSDTFLAYNQNMRQLVFDKIAMTDLVVFNRFDAKFDKQAFHKVVRAITRRCDILFEYPNGQVERDDIEDPLPYDINLNPIVIENKDYAYFYRDLCEDMKKYDGKNIVLSGLVAKTAKMPKDSFLIGRSVMTCCEADIKYTPLVATCNLEVKDRTFVKITAQISLEKHVIYADKGPVLKVSKIELSSEPDDVVTYY